MPKLFGIVAFVVLQGLVAVQSHAADDDKADADRRQGNDATTIHTDPLEGTWELTGFEFAGMEIAVPKGVEMSLTFKGGKVTKKELGKNDEEGTYKIDATRKPMKIDLTTPKNSDPKMKETSKAICSVTGDALKIAFGGKPEAPRPSDFDANDIGILNFKKVKK